MDIYTQTPRNVHHECQQRSARLQIVHTRSAHSLLAVTAIASKLPRPWQPSTDALRKGVAHHRKHPVQHRRSTCQARGHAAQVQVSAARHWQHACSITATPVAHGATIQPIVAHAVHPRGRASVPPLSSTFAATAQQRVGLFPPDKLSNVTRDQGSVASAVSATIASMCGSDVFPHLPHDFRDPPL